MTLGWYDVQITSAMRNASSRLREIIKEAKHQLPINQKGVIVIQTQYSDILPDIATQRSSRADYGNIVSIIGVDSSRNIKIIKDETHSYISDNLL